MVNVQSSGSHIVREIYARKPDWWARWTWPMVLGIAVWTAVGAETVFNHWTQRAKVDSALPAQKSDNATAESQTSSSSKSIQWEPRPLYQRALLSVSILGFGTGLGILFLSGRSRIVKRILGVSSPANTHHTTKGDASAHLELRYIVVETIGSFGSGKGKVFPKEKCELTSGRNDSEMLLRVQGARDFWLGVKDAMIEGSPATGGAWAVRQKLMESLEQGKKVGKWRSGPILEGRP